jgi:hypothetical protein
MNVLWVFGIVAGAVFGFRRLNFLTLLLLIAVVAASTAVAAWPRPSFIDLVAGVALPQLAYILGIIALASAQYIAAMLLRGRAMMRIGGTMRSVRNAIGQELRVTFEIPHDIPDEIARLVAQMRQARYA